jgi:hypothetical protein
MGVSKWKVILLAFQYVAFNDVVFQMTRENGEDFTNTVNT